MKNYLIIANNTHILRYLQFFSKILGSEGYFSLHFLILNHETAFAFKSFEEQSVFVGGHRMISVKEVLQNQSKLKPFFSFAKETQAKTNLDEVFESSHQSESDLFMLVEKLKSEICSDQDFLMKHNISNSKFDDMRVLESSEVEQKPTFNLIDKSQILDIKYNKNQRKMILELKNTGTQFFDLVFAERSDLVIEFLGGMLGSQAKQIIKNSDNKTYKVWHSYTFKVENFQFSEEFYIVFDSYIDELVDNVVFLKPDQSGVVIVWALIPEHQKLNTQFHQEYHKILLAHLREKLSFAQIELSSLKMSEYNFCYSKKSCFKKHNLFIEFPPLDFYSNQSVTRVFEKIENEFTLKNKIKNLIPTVENTQQ